MLIRRIPTGLTLGCGGVLLIALGGRWSGWLDVMTTFAPLLVLGLILCGAVALKGSAPPRAGLLIAMVAGLGAGAVLILPEYVRSIPMASGKAPPLRVLTANVWRDNAEATATLHAIARADADIVLLQETDGAVGRGIDRLRHAYPYRSGCVSRTCGAMILSKRPFADRRFRILDRHGRKTGPGFVYARTTAPDGGPVTLITLHYTWPLPQLGQDRQRRRLVEALRFVDKSDLILAGDMNLTPWSYAMARQDAALAPLVRHTRALWSWPARLRGGWRWPVPFLPIDQLYAGPHWRQVSVARLPATGSDHYPVLAVLARR